MQQFTAPELKRHLAQAGNDTMILDVREPWEFQLCHLEHAQLIPIRQIPVAVGSLDPGRETVVVCHHGIRSYQVANYLERCGFANVINLSGGMAAWSRDVDPLVPTY